VPLPLAVQLYTFRDPDRFGGAGLGLDTLTLTAIAEAGFLGVETVDVPGGDAAEARRVLDDLGLAIASSHTWADIADADDVARRAEALAELGSRRMIVSHGPVGDGAALDALVDQLGSAASVASEHGMRLGYHNHSAEMASVDGTPVIERLRAGLGAAIDFQVDIFWVVVGGAEPAAVVERLAPQVVSLHLKDGVELPAAAYDPAPFRNVPVGSGVVDPAPAVAAAEAAGSVEWLIVEFDHIEGPPIDGVRASLRHLVERGLARSAARTA
jgi:sugar phosphate isomerase/epimerase